MALYLGETEGSFRLNKMWLRSDTRSPLGWVQPNCLPSGLCFLITWFCRMVWLIV